MVAGDTGDAAGAGFTAGADPGGSSETGFCAVWQALAASSREAIRAIRKLFEVRGAASRIVLGPVRLWLDLPVLLTAYFFIPL